jgi:hypothetical protein
MSGLGEIRCEESEHNVVAHCEFPKNGSGKAVLSNGRKLNHI